MISKTKNGKYNKVILILITVFSVFIIFVVYGVCIILMRRNQANINYKNHLAKSINSSTISKANNSQQSSSKTSSINTSSKQENEYFNLLYHSYGCLSDTALDDSKVLSYGFSKQNDNIYTKIISNETDFEYINSKLNLKYDWLDYNQYTPTGDFKAQFVKFDILLCIKNTNGIYGYFTNYRNSMMDYKRFEAIIIPDVALDDSLNINNIQINAKELSGKKGALTTNGYAILIPKTKNKIKIEVKNEYLSNINFMDNEVKITKEKALEIATKELRNDGIKDNPSSATIEIVNQLIIEKCDDKNIVHQQTNNQVTEEKLVRVWHIYSNADSPGCSVNIYLDATTGIVLCYHWTGE
jgi:hypothetical protein